MPKLIRILLVEDDIEDAFLFQRRCPPDCRVQHVTSLEAGLSALNEDGCDVCFADYRLGSRSGLDLVRAARDAGLRTPIVLVTGQDTELLGENALLAGASDFVPKDDLDGATISRIARWCLIRRHVENRREDGPSDEMIRRLMGRMPTTSMAAAAGTAHDGRLRRMVYLSKACYPVTSQELVSMACRFASANAYIQVTGVLIYISGRFMQVIEGERAALDSLMQRIERDPRHGEIVVIVDESITARAFADWNMGCCHVNDSRELSPSRWQVVVNQVSRVVAESGSARDGIDQLLRQLPTVLDRARLDVH